MKQILTLSGFHCDACTKLSSKRLNKIPGVTQVTPLETQGMFEIESDRQLTVEDIQSVLEGTGYGVISIE